jgi:hypothetical protein
VREVIKFPPALRGGPRWGWIRSGHRYIGVKRKEKPHKNAEKSSLAVLFMVVGILMTVSHGRAEVSCHKINAKGVGQDLGGGTATADIIGGGLLQGTTVGNFTITGGAFPVFSIAGTVEFTTNNGTLTVTITGTFT